MLSTKQMNLLIEAAREASKKAFCPYSNFHVGAAVLDNDGEIWKGFNIENASYGLTICAERVAIFNWRVHSDSKILALAVTCPDGNPEEDENSVMPCGACRQVMSEFMTEDAQIFVDGIGEFVLNDLLPFPFEL